MFVSASSFLFMFMFMLMCMCMGMFVLCSDPPAPCNSHIMELLITHPKKNTRH